MIQELYKTYFQKSFTFLYPLLGFNKLNSIVPKQTYIQSDDVSITEKSLICLYDKLHYSDWDKFEDKKLLPHKYLNYVIPVNNQYILYVFDLNMLNDTFELFINGKYSKFSIQTKKLLSIYYGINSPEWSYIESFLYPQRYFTNYSILLDAPIETLENVGELCDKLDIQKETFNIKNLK